MSKKLRSGDPDTCLHDGRTRDCVTEDGVVLRFCEACAEPLRHGELLPMGQGSGRSWLILWSDGRTEEVHP